MCPAVSKSQSFVPVAASRQRNLQTKLACIPSPKYTRPSATHGQEIECSIRPSSVDFHTTRLSDRPKHQTAPQLDSPASSTADTHNRSPSSRAAPTAPP